VISFVPPPFYVQGKSSSTQWKGGWVDQELIWMQWQTEKFPVPARNQHGRGTTSLGGNNISIT